MKFGFEDLVTPPTRWDKAKRWAAAVFSRTARLIRTIIGVLIGWAVVYLITATFLAGILLAFWHLMATWFGMLEVRPLLHFENLRTQTLVNQILVTLGLSILFIGGVGCHKRRARRHAKAKRLKLPPYE